MARIIYFDCFSGISGDMALGALIDVGLSVEALQAELEKLGVPDWSLSSERGMRRYISGTRALVHAPEQETHRHLADVQAIIEASTLDPIVKQRSLHIFTLLAEAEGRVHGVPAEQVHFHEVGALDAIVDIVGVVAGLALLGIEQVYASPVPLGSGWVRAAHGALPIPAPATLYLLTQAGAPTQADQLQGEVVTPTGAALLAGMAEFRRPAMQLEQVGYGLGGRDPEDRPNVLRVWIGQVANNSLQQPVLLETNIDDQPAEQLAYTAEQLLTVGALDVWMQPIQMKKGRPGIVLAALVPPALEDAAVAMIMRETTTLGIRRRIVERHVCERELAQIETEYGIVRIKRKRWAGVDLGGAPEYEDCARIAREHGIPLREVYRMVADAI